MTNNNLSIASLLRDDKSKMATLIACGASAVALIYYNREVRNQIANIFMVRFLLLLFGRRRRLECLSMVFFYHHHHLFLMMMMPLLAWEREKRRVASFASVDVARDGRRALWCEREEERWRVDKPERDWIFGSKFSLAAVIISSFHLHQREASFFRF